MVASSDVDAPTVSLRRSRSRSRRSRRSDGLGGHSDASDVDLGVAAATVSSDVSLSQYQIRRAVAAAAGTLDLGQHVAVVYDWDKKAAAKAAEKLQQQQQYFKDAAAARAAMLSSSSSSSTSVDIVRTSRIVCRRCKSRHALWAACRR